MVLDIRKLYSTGMTYDVFRPMDVPQPDEATFEIEFCESILKSNPDHFETLVLLGDAFTRKGDFSRGLDLDLRLSSMRPENKNISYNLACSYALTGQKEKALNCLTKAIDLGYNDLKHLREDHDLDTIKNDPRFVTLLGRLNTDEVDKQKSL
jgi:tetratricopeptide (TPR) repeat protein